MTRSSATNKSIFSRPRMMRSSFIKRAITISNFSFRQFSASKIPFRKRVPSFARKLLLGSAILSVAMVASPSFYSNSEGKQTDDRFASTSLYPILEPFDKNTLKVSDIHTISYTQYGNPHGKPVLFIHGGPGGGTNANMARFFDPKVYRIILVDQRGCGESTPFANLQDNTTYDSVRDFEKLRKKLGIKKWQLFGGSWGSTLALAYAIEHPECVSELVLRGIFLCRQKEFDWMYEGKGANFIFPEDWEMYENAIPVEERNNFMKAYSRRLLGELGEEEMIKAAKAWSIWEGRISKLNQDPVESFSSTFADPHYATAFARIENHYFMNQAFFPRDGFLIEKENIAKIAHIPTVIVQGRYDVVCPAISAYDLHKAMPNAEIHFVLAGHSAFETEIIKKLVAATENFKHRK